MFPLATVSLRLTPTLLAQIDHAAAARGMTRSDWMRVTLLDPLQDEQRHEELHALEQQLLTRLENLQAVIINHVTTEIDSLTKG
jgi:uncharacterized protein (DUF1778 family)